MTTTTLITGGNRGIGFETARRLAAAGHAVWIGARDPERGRIAAAALGVFCVPLDTTDDASVAAAVATLTESAGHLDVLINNAGVIGTDTSVDDLTVEGIRTVYETNVFGMVRVTQAFLPLLRTGAAPSVINVTSGLGSFALTSDPERVESRITRAAYGSSKSAVTMLTMQYAKAVKDVRFNAADPGQTATEFNGFRGHDVVRGTDAIVRLATAGRQTPNGTVVDREGRVPW